MKYEEIIHDAFIRIIKVASKMPGNEFNYVKKQLSLISDHLNRTTEKCNELSEKATGTVKGGYNDSLIYFSNILILHGYDDLTINHVFSPEFIQWFLDSALESPNYKPDKINAFILKAFSDGFKLFCFEHDRQPKDYLELRNFVLNWETIIDSRIEKQIKELTNED